MVFSGQISASMRLHFFLAALLAAVSAVAAPVPLKQFDRVEVYGTDYIRIQDWAKSNQFEFRWIDSGEFYLSRNQIKLVFAADSPVMQINGINVVLTSPVAVRNRVGYVSPVDLERTIQPILFPKKQPSKIKSICIDPGHGGKDPGNLEKGAQEKKYTLLLAQELAKVLKKAGYKAFLTRTFDNYVERTERAEYANKKNADLFLSLHYNSAEKDSVSGVEVYCMTPAGSSSSNARGEGAVAFNYPGNVHNSQNIVLAFQMQKALVNLLPVEDRGVRRARFEVLREAKMPAILIEGGFMSNTEEARRIYSTKSRAQFANAILQGLQAYVRAVELETDAK